VGGLTSVLDIGCWSVRVVFSVLFYQLMSCCSKYSEKSIAVVMSWDVNM
jgi:hypothetical protein